MPSLVPPVRNEPRTPPLPATVGLGPPTSFARLRPRVLLLVEDGIGSGNFAAAPEVLDWASVTLGLDETETQATLIVQGLNAARLSNSNPTGDPRLGDEHLSHLLELLSPERRVRIGAGFTTGSPVILFQGWPLTHEVRWDGESQGLVVTCISEADEFLAASPFMQLYGQNRRQTPWLPWDPANPDTTFLDAAPLVFNPSGKPNRSPRAVPTVVEGNTHFIYLPCDADVPQWTNDNAPNQNGPPAPLTQEVPQQWMFVNALRYLVARHIAGFGGSPSVADFLIDTDNLIDEVGLASGDPFIDLMTRRVPGVTCAAMNAREALHVVCAAGGLHFHLPLTAVKNGEPVYTLRVLATLRDDAEELTTPTRRMIAPKVRDMPRQAPFTDNEGVPAIEVARQNQAGFDSQLTIDHRHVNAPQLVGGVRTYECSLLLRPGWKPFVNLDNLAQASQAAKDAALAWWIDQLGVGNELDEDTKLPTSIYHADHPAHFAVSEVGRLWVFPDTLDYFQNGFEREGWDAKLYDPFMPVPSLPTSVYQHSSLGGGVADAMGWMSRRRPFRDTIARAAKDSDRSPLVRVAYDFTWIGGDPINGYNATWLAYKGKPWIDTERAALRFTAANLLLDASLREDPEDEESLSMIQAIIEGTFAVAVTCCVEGDSRISHTVTPPSTERPRAAISDLSEKFQHLRRRGQNSHLSPINDPTRDEPAYENREDDAALQLLGDRMAAAGRPSAAGTVKVPWIDCTGTGWMPGDSVSGCSGIDIPLTSYPEVVAKTYQNSGGAMSTVYQLGDLRNAPELA